MVQSIIEGGAYVAVKAFIIESGKSDEYADCFVEMLKLMGATHDVTHGNVKKLVDKSKFIDFVCSHGGIYAAVGVLILALLLLCSCFRCCCIRSSSKPMVIRVNVPAAFQSTDVPYERMEKV